MGNLSRAPERKPLDLRTALLVKVLSQLELQVAIGEFTQAESDPDIAHYERKLAEYGGVPVACLVRDGVDHV